MTKPQAPQKQLTRDNHESVDRYHERICPWHTVVQYYDQHHHQMGAIGATVVVSLECPQETTGN